MSTSSSILIVDDEPNMLDTLRDILEGRGYHVSTTTTGDAAVALCITNTYDVILMDVRMPGISGVEAFRKIRRNQAGARVILMSAYSVDELKRAALEEGAVAFFHKPLDVESTIKLIEESKDTAILIIDSDDREVQAVETRLRQEGYWVRTARSAHDALELLLQVRFGVIFIDTRLPAMTGLELYLAVRKVTPSAVAIMMAGNEGEFMRIAEEAVRRTAYAIVQKPLDLDHVLALLKRVATDRASCALRKPGQVVG